MKAHPGVRRADIWIGGYPELMMLEQTNIWKHAAPTDRRILRYLHWGWGGCGDWALWNGRIKGGGGVR